MAERCGVVTVEVFEIRLHVRGNLVKKHKRFTDESYDVGKICNGGMVLTWEALSLDILLVCVCGEK